MPITDEAETGYTSSRSPTSSPTVTAQRRSGRPRRPSDVRLPRAPHCVRPGHAAARLTLRAASTGSRCSPTTTTPSSGTTCPQAPHLTMVKDGSGRDVPSFLLVALIAEDDDGGLLSFDCNIGLTQAADRRRWPRRSRNAEDLANDATARAGAPRRRHGAADHPRHRRRASAAGEPTRPESPFVVSRRSTTRKPSLYGENQAAFSVHARHRTGTPSSGDARRRDHAGRRRLLAGLPGAAPGLQRHAQRSTGTGCRSTSTRASRPSCSSSRTEISKAVDELVESKAIELRGGHLRHGGHRGRHRPPRRRPGAGAGHDHRRLLRSPASRPGRRRSPSDWEKALRLGSELVTQRAAGRGGTGGRDRRR